MVKMIDQKVLDEFHMADTDSLYEAISSRNVTPYQIIDFLHVRKKSSDVKEIRHHSSMDAKNPVVVDGVDNLAISLAKCCCPIPGDDIVGYVSKGKGIIVHRITCPNIANAGKRTIPVHWNEDLGISTYPVAIQIYAGDRNNLLTDIMGVFSAKNAQQGLSLLTGKEGEKIASDIVTLTDDPFLPGHQAAFDGEGVATARKNVIENGVFKTLLYNLQTAKKAGRETTGNASRASYYAPVDIAPFNFYVQPGSATAEEIWKTAASEGTALLITELAGLHAGLNPITGDFSLMAGGYRLEDGKKTSWVNGITVSGNFYELLKKISAVGSDLKFGFPMGTTRIGSPSVYCGLMPIAGK